MSKKASKARVRALEQRVRILEDQVARLAQQVHQMPVQGPIGPSVPGYVPVAPYPGTYPYIITCSEDGRYPGGPVLIDHPQRNLSETPYVKHEVIRGAYTRR